jgi:hypothetical protein
MGYPPDWMKSLNLEVEFSGWMNKNKGESEYCRQTYPILPGSRIALKCSLVREILYHRWMIIRG